MVPVPSVTLEEALERSAELQPPQQQSRRAEAEDGSRRSDRRARAGAVVDLLKIDCEGCEHEVMPHIERAVAAAGSAAGATTSGDGRAGSSSTSRVVALRKVTGECHATRGLTDPQKLRCMRVLRGVKDCPHGITPFLTCRSKPRASTTGG